MKTLLFLLCLLLLVATPILSYGMGCTPKEPKEKPMVVKPEPVPVTPEKTAIIKAKPKPPCVVKATKLAGKYEVLVSKDIIKLDNAYGENAIKVRVNIGYMTYESEVVGKVATVKIPWNPGGKVTVGLWNAKTGKYISSAYLGETAANLPG